jgi:hypothetical protein
MREQIKVLEYHTDFSSDLVDIGSSGNGFTIDSNGS